MDAPPDKEDVRPFMHVARLLRDVGLNAPEVLEADPAQGFLLLTDLGRDTYLTVLNDSNAAALFAEATEALLRWQQATRSGELPPYDEALLRRELALFPDWYVERHLGMTLSARQREVLDRMFGPDRRREPGSADGLRAPRLHAAQPDGRYAQSGHSGFSGRGDRPGDLRPRPRCSCDAFISWDEERVIDWSIRYWERARSRRPAGGRRTSACSGATSSGWALQRHLKGARHLCRHQLPRWQAELPGGHAALREVRAHVAQRYDELARWLGSSTSSGGGAVRVGYTF